MGVSFVIGSGSTYVRCPQHVVANLKGTAVGAVVNGPNGKDQFAGGPRRLSPAHEEVRRPRLAAFDGKGSRFVDDVRSWQSTEPALDFTALGTYALSLF